MSRVKKSKYNAKTQEDKNTKEKQEKLSKQLFDTLSTKTQQKN